MQFPVYALVSVVDTENDLTQLTGLRLNGHPAIAIYESVDDANEMAEKIMTGVQAVPCLDALLDTLEQLDKEFTHVGINPSCKTGRQLLTVDEFIERLRAGD